MTKEKVINCKLQNSPPLKQTHDDNVVKLSDALPIQTNASARDNAQNNQPASTKQTGIYITKHINIIGAPSSKVQVNSWTSVVTDDEHLSANHEIPITGYSKPPKIEFTTTQASAVFVGQTDERIPTPIESVEFFPKPVSQERRAREKQIISQPVYESIPNSYEKVRRLAGDQQNEQAQSINVLEGQAMGPLRQSSKEAYLGERMLNRDRDVVNTTSTDHLPDGVFQKLMTDFSGEPSQAPVQPNNPSTLNRYITSNLGRISDPSSVSAASQMPLYGQHEKPADAQSEGPVALDFSQFSPSSVKDTKSEGAQVVPGLASFVIASSGGQNLSDVRQMVKMMSDAEGTSHATVPSSTDQQLAVLQSMSIDQSIPQMHGSPLVSVRPTEHPMVPDQATHDQLSTRVAQSTIPSNRPDSDRNNQRFDYASNIPNMPRTDEAEVYEIPLGPPLHTGIQSQHQMVDLGQSPAVSLDLEKSELRSPAITNLTGKSISVAEPSQGEIPLVMHHSVPGALVPDQRSNVVMLNEDVLETDRAIRTEKLSTNVDRISRTPAITMHNVVVTEPFSYTSECVVQPNNMLMETSTFDHNMGYISQETVPKVTTVAESSEVIAAVQLSPKVQFGLPELIQINYPENFNQLHEVLCEHARLTEHISPEVSDNKSQSEAYRGPYFSAINVEPGISSQGQPLLVDRPILPGKYQIGDSAAPMFLINEPSSSKARIAESRRSKDTLDSIVTSQPKVELSTVPLPQSPISDLNEGNKTPEVHQNLDDGMFEIDPTPVQRLPSLPKPPVLGRDHSLDQVESYEDSEYADTIPQPIGKNGPESRPIGALHDPVSIGIDRVEPIDAIGQMRLKPERTTGNPSSKVTIHNGLSQEVQGPSIEFHSGHVNSVSVSDRPQIQYSCSTFSMVPESNLGEVEKMRRLKRYTEATSSKSHPVVPPTLPKANELSGTSQIRITKETVNRRVEWDWKRDIKTNDDRDDPHGREIGWASMNDAYEVHREVRLYTEGFVPPFTLGDHPQILINLDGRAGVEYNVDFGNSGNFHVGVRANGTTSNVPTAPERNIEQDDEIGKTLRNLCLPISRLFPKRSPTTQ
ncbi:hypothetical protein FGIG_07724 [Fasciola gigantica]|uniref:Uncharacterized protein n=1 Tax=Fasciola gigantica TaxID=46835 RepID=A0A504YTG8_FASGI|nr:hypothetical protein FGIG_07724 [Fasciola gigantica]